MKLEIGKLYNVSRPKISMPIYSKNNVSRPIISIPIKLSSNIEFLSYKEAKHDVLHDQIIMLLSDKIELSWGGNAYKILTETGDVGYIYENNSVKLVFTAIS
jgi:hypothetical protein